jgi:predicted metal-dependent peptidase
MAVAMTGDAREMMSAAKIQLLRDHPFWATVLLSLPMVETDTVPIMGTDGYSLYWHPEGVKILGSVENIKFALCHELVHVIMDHMQRGVNKDRKMFNIAADIVDNHLLERNSISFNQRDTEISLWNAAALAKIQSMKDIKLDEVTSEEVYKILLEKSKKVKCTCGSGKSSGKGGGSGDGDGEGDGDGDSKCPAHGDASGFDTHIHKQREDHENTKVKHAIVKAAQTAQAQGQGKLPAGMDRFIKEILEPQVDWWVKLKNMMDSKCRGYKRVRLYPSKKSHAIGHFIPSAYGTQVGDVVAAIDTSGSISDAMLRRFLAEIMGMAHLSKRTYIMTCDADVHEYIEADTLSVWQIPGKIKFKGGGGTDFRPVFARVKKERIRPKILVYLTDTYGSFPSKKPDYPVLWCVVGGAKEVPWGEVIHVKE